MTNREDFNQHAKPQPIRGDKGATMLGPRNLQRELQNPDMIIPPETDSGTVTNLKFSFADTHVRIQEGGWSREVTQRELPVSDTLAAVNMRLKPGGIRELHWHKEAEWAYMLEGRARITAIDGQGRSFIDDVEKGDLWYFPSGIPHSIVGLEEGCEFVLIFDDGQFSENSTFSIADWIAHTPKDVLADNFGVSESAFDNMPDGELYMFQGKVPGSIDQEKPKNLNEPVPNPFSFRLKDMDPIESQGGKVRIADSTNFKASKTIAAALVEVEPGGIRELHWHPNQAEWQYYISGKARMSVFGAEGHARTFDYQAGDVGYVPFAFGHYIQNTGDTPLVFLEMFKSDHFEDISLNQWMSQTPPEFLKEHLHISDEFIEKALHADKQPIVNFNKKEEQ
ncbi:oxalate decarboxylase family bicupin [Aciduricibacillus chroicocephali]|uniref:Oxalate decarboxylase family bicupin n=1 Tax=Aciduricibacillus chroicocephali TaxID=3054939 RepID=A0ABY9KWR8_9BACI|nr:oxalate decarboxylase family bicupin [Bacillaceae bacterium 44XB]